jgi:hypothetical protein
MKWIRENEPFVNIYQGAATPKKGSAVGSDFAGQLESELAKLGGLGLRNLPVLEARKGKKKNGTAVASGAAVSRFHQHRASWNHFMEYDHWLSSQAAGTGAAKKKAKAAKAKNAKGTGAAATVSASPWFLPKHYSKIFGIWSIFFSNNSGNYVIKC